MECEQCQIAQASTIRETETATGLIYYWRKTEIKCSATACETYGAHIVPTTFVLPFVFNIFFPPSPLHASPDSPPIYQLDHDFIYFISRHRCNTAYCRVFTERLCPARVKSRWNGTTVLLARPFHPRRMPTLPECNARVYKHSNPRRKCVGWITETKTRDKLEEDSKASRVFNLQLICLINKGA